LIIHKQQTISISMNEISFKLFFSFLLALYGFGCAPEDEKEVSAPENNWKLLWSDEFEGSEVDTTKWLFETGAHGWGNNEWQNYTPGDNAEVSGGVLRIIARKTGEGQKAGDYTSTRMNSKKSFTYGRMEVRAKMPDYRGPGLWPAIWMLGENIKEIGWPESGEIDIMEYVSRAPDSVLQTIHTGANNHMEGTQIGTGFMELETIEEEFHNYGIIWEEEVLHFYIDSPENITLSIERPDEYNQENWPFDKPFYFLLNMAVGGNLGGVEGVDDSIFPAVFEIDYVRVWERVN